MTVNVGKELAALRRMSVDDLRSRYAEVFGETTNARGAPRAKLEYAWGDGAGLCLDARKPPGV